MPMKIVYIFIIISTSVFVLWVFINTIITKKWRNRVPNESECWKFSIFYYNPLDKRSFIFGIGLFENLYYIYSKDVEFQVGLLFHIGIKL